MKTLDKAMKKRSSEENADDHKKNPTSSNPKEKNEPFKSPQIGANWSQVLGLSSKLSEKLGKLDLNEESKGKDPFFIGVCGGTCAGKKNIVRLIKNELNDIPISVLSQENFYKNFSNEENFNPDNVDWDSPSATDWELFHQAIESLENHKSFRIPIYNLIKEQREHETMLVSPSQIVIIDGVLIFNDVLIRDKCNLKIFLDTDEDVRLSRKVYRDVCIRKKNVEDVVFKYLRYTKVAFSKYTMPTKQYADIIIPNYGGGFSTSSQIFEDDEHHAGFINSEHPALNMIIAQLGRKMVK